MQTFRVIEINATRIYIREQNNQRLKKRTSLMLTSSGELSPLLWNGLLNHWEKSSDELKMLGNKKLSSAHNSSRLFYIKKKIRN